MRKSTADRLVKYRREGYDFVSKGHLWRRDFQALVARIWKNEVGSDNYPLLDELGELQDVDAHVRFHRLLELLTPFVHSGRRPERSAETKRILASRPTCDNYGRPVNGTRHPLSTRVFDLLKRSPKPLDRAELQKMINRTRREPVKLKAISSTLSALRIRGLTVSPGRGLWCLT